VTEWQKTFAQRLASHRVPLKQRQSDRLRSFGADQERLWRAAACRRYGELGYPRPPE